MTMRQDATFEELEGLRRQFNMLIDKVERQPIVSDGMLRQTMERGSSAVEREYRMRLRACLMAGPMLLVFFLCAGIHWSYIVFVAVLAGIEYVLNHRNYRALAPQSLAGLSMTDATERVARFRKMRSRMRKWLVAPAVVLCVWTVMVACRFSWNWSIIALTVVMLILALLNAVRKEKDVDRSLDEVLRGISELRGDR